MKRTIVTLFLVGGGILFGYLSLHGRQTVTMVLPSLSVGALPTGTAEDDIPLAGASARTTRKKFGIYVTPRKSPVSPERFTGYHTGLDFETYPQEQNTVVTVRALCDGKLILKKYATGYGGVAVESCTFNGQAVTVVYGHLNVNSIHSSLNAVVHRGDAIGALGKGYSTQTDGERKHLHLGIHRGTAIDIRGYVRRSTDLKSWIDPATLLP